MSASDEGSIERDLAAELERQGRDDGMDAPWVGDLESDGRIQVDGHINLTRLVEVVVQRIGRPSVEAAEARREVLSPGWPGEPPVSQAVERALRCAEQVESLRHAEQLPSWPLKWLEVNQQLAEVVRRMSPEERREYVLRRRGEVVSPAEHPHVWRGEPVAECACGKSQFVGRADPIRWK